MSCTVLFRSLLELELDEYSGWTGTRTAGSIDRLDRGLEHLHVGDHDVAAAGADESAFAPTR